MPLFTLLRHAPPAPAITLRSPFKVHSSPRPFTCPSLRPAAPLRRDLGAGISSIGCRAAADASSSEFPAAGDGDSAPWGLILRAGEVLSLGFPVWVASACALALWRPPAFLWVGPTARMVGLSFTMLGMGMTLTLDDLKTALLMPKELAVGFLLQYTNSVLGVVLANKHFENPLTAVPCAVSSVCHSVYGSILSGIWRSMSPSDKGE